jgi:hypothetical protein
MEPYQPGNLANLDFLIFLQSVPVLGNSMKTKIPQHKRHSDRIAQKWVILCTGTKGLRDKPLEFSVSKLWVGKL